MIDDKIPVWLAEHLAGNPQFRLTRFGQAWRLHGPETDVLSRRLDEFNRLDIPRPPRE